MNRHRPNDLSSLSLLELFCAEVEDQAVILTNGLLELERAPALPHQLEILMRAAHSLKGAARIVSLQSAVRVAHAMEDAFVAAQQGLLPLGRNQIDTLLRGVDLLMQIAKGTEEDSGTWEKAHEKELEAGLNQLQQLVPPPGAPPPAPENDAVQPARQPDPPSSSQQPALPHSATPIHLPVPAERVLRLTAANLDRLLGLAGEFLVESSWLRPFSDSLQRLKRLHVELNESIEALRAGFEQTPAFKNAEARLNGTVQKVVECREFLVARLEELDLFDRRSAELSHRLYLEVLRARMRPFADGVRRFPRMVRDLARGLGKEVRLEIADETTQVDRDILERLEAPLAHLLRNAVDHGCESPAERTAAGKPPEGVVRIEARHRAGMLLVSVSDDGAGIDPRQLRARVVQRNLADPAEAGRLADAELLEFLFLPGFTMKDNVTEISGRGVGLDVVLNLVKSVRGTARISSQPGLGTRIQLQLPLTLSVLRTLLVEVAGEAYAIPLSQIDRTCKLSRDHVKKLEGRHYFTLGHQPVGLLSARRVLECEEAGPATSELHVVVVGDGNARYGLIVDRFLGERELVVQPLDPRLGKVKDISAAALMDDGAPVLIIDVEGVLASIERRFAEGLPTDVLLDQPQPMATRRKRILAVDDSLTVRELERKLLSARGYLADVAVDGIDGWCAIRTGQYDLVIADVDMPRMDGIELATLIKQDPALKSIPVLIVSYKDREEDRLRGLNAGADYYLSKGRFDDQTLLQAVADLIGDPES